MQTKHQNVLQRDMGPVVIKAPNGPAAAHVLLRVEKW